ncbi:MAG: M3 family metallopeptidase, partial [Eubacteriales bacterium]
EAVDSDEFIALEWARIPHFYRAFYVYQYATGFSCAITIANNILKEGKPAVDAYKQFLKSGGSDYPLEELKIAGVDLVSGAPVDICMKEFKSALDELKQLF